MFPEKMLVQRESGGDGGVLIRTLDRPRSRFLVYTSAGDKSNVDQWIRGARCFDLWITYYADGALPQHGDYVNARKGGKYQNLHHVYQVWPHILQRYSAILVMDDDIVINTASINRLFELREQFDYWVLQPAFTPWGKISFPITKVQRSCLRRHTNFVENNVPLFRRDLLDAFMEVYEPILVGWGIDWWYLDVMGPDLNGRVAIIDEVSCVNPRDRTKGGREIDRLQPTAVRTALWRQVKDTYGIKSEERGPIEYERFPRKPLPAAAGAVTDWLEEALVKTLITLRAGPVREALVKTLGTLRRSMALPLSLRRSNMSADAHHAVDGNRRSTHL